MNKQATKDNNSNKVKTENAEKTENIEMSTLQAKKLEDAVQNRQLAQQQLAMMNNAEQDITHLICDSHGIDPDKVMSVNVNGNVLTVKMVDDGNP